jgi:hypothetical protein
LDKASGDPGFARELARTCAQDIVFWVDNFCWTKDPRRADAVLPFISYPIQAEALLEVERAVNTGFDLLIEKSRDMGASWIVDYVLQHQFQFYEGADFRVGSRKEEFVDKLGVMDTMLEKIRWNLGRQPLFLLPAGFQEQTNFNDNTTYMRLNNPERFNSIVGESANPHFGSGGRSKAVVMDEYAKWESGVDAQAWTSTADVTKCRIPISTPVGSANKFARLAKGHDEKIKLLTLHWTLHPDKARGAYYVSNGIRIPIDLKKDYKSAFNIWSTTFGRESKKVFSPWYEAEAERRTDADLAQEVDIDYHRSGSMFFNARALARQKAWTEFKRALPTDPIPYGRYIRANVIELQDKVRIKDAVDGWLMIAELPKEGYQYVVSADSSEGLPKGDESFGVVRCKVTGNVVAIFHNQWAPEEFAKLIQLAAWFYNEADGAPENNNHGYTTCKELEDKPHVKLYFTRKDETVDGSVKVTHKRGFTTDLKSRPDMLNHLAAQIDKAEIELRFQVLIDQARTFIRNAKRGGKPEADGDFKDDGVLATAIGGAVIRELPYEPKSVNTAKRTDLIDSRRVKKNAGFGFE